MGAYRCPWTGRAPRRRGGAGRAACSCPAPATAARASGRARGWPSRPPARRTSSAPSCWTASARTSGTCWRTGCSSSRPRPRPPRRRTWRAGRRSPAAPASSACARCACSGRSGGRPQQNIGLFCRWERKWQKNNIRYRATLVDGHRGWGEMGGGVYPYFSF